MPLHHLPQRDWPGFLEAFALQHYGWMCSIEVADSSSAAPHRIASDARLLGVALENDPTARVLMSIQSDGKQIEHSVQQPCEILEEKTAEGISSGLQVRSSQGSTARLVFRSPIAPELVDGITPTPA
jgi:hypothetical protein